MKTTVVAASVMFAAGLCGTVVAGSLDSPGAPSGGSGMYSLLQIYDYLNSGIKTTPVPSFQEPGTAPGPTMKTTKQIYDDIVAKMDQCVVTAAHVESGWTFFCTQTDSWGVKTGTLVAGCPEGESCYRDDHSDLTVSIVPGTFTTIVENASGTAVGQISRVTTSWTASSSMTLLQLSGSCGSCKQFRTGDIRWEVSGPGISGQRTILYQERVNDGDWPSTGMATDSDIYLSTEAGGYYTLRVSSVGAYSGDPAPPLTVQYVRWAPGIININ
ncbi:MAG: hypothetical protein NTZ78_07785 [Candidatus Aureabacteria bacterium]|nr:hypothetical protein [Candidatus Auribacterota bacterium]